MNFATSLCVLIACGIANSHHVAIRSPQLPNQMDDKSKDSIMAGIPFPYGYNYISVGSLTDDRRAVDDGNVARGSYGPRPAGPVVFPDDPEGTDDVAYSTDRESSPRADGERPVEEYSSEMAANREADVRNIIMDMETVGITWDDSGAERESDLDASNSI